MIFLMRSFGCRKWRFRCKRRGVWTVHRTAHVSHAQTSRASLKANKAHLFVCCLKNSHPHERIMIRTLLYPALFSPALRTPTSSSLLYPWNRTNAFSTPQGLLSGRIAEQSPLTGYEPNALVGVSSTEVTTPLPSRKASNGSETRSSHVRTRTGKPVATCSNEKIESRLKCCAGALFRKVKNFWAFINSWFPWLASWSSCSRRKNCSIKTVWSRIWYEIPSWGTKKIFCCLKSDPSWKCKNWGSIVETELFKPGESIVWSFSERRELVVHRIGQKRKSSSRGSHEKCSGNRRN